IRDASVTGVQTCALPICTQPPGRRAIFYQWVEVAAKLVERLALDSEHTRYRISLAGREAECTVATSEAPGLTSLIGADVRIRARSEERRVGKEGSMTGLA